MSDVKSPLSPHAEIRLLQSFRASELISDWKTCFDIDITGELKGIEEVNLYRCEESGLEFFLPLSVAGSAMLYKALQKFDWFYMPDKWEFEEAIKDLAGCTSLLEVGCGQGFFIEKALKQLTCRGIKGIEYSEEAVQTALKKQLNVEKATLKDLIERRESFDAICSFQVLEHVSLPLQFLEDVLLLLKPGGALILCVPNKESFLKYQYNLLDMPPHHMTKWSLETFKYLEKIFPLKLINASFEPLAEYHIEGYMKAYGEYVCKSIPVPSLALHYFSNLLKISRLYRYCRGQSLYIRFKKL